jgi:hypothetical protein
MKCTTIGKGYKLMEIRQNHWTYRIEPLKRGDNSLKSDKIMMHKKWKPLSKPGKGDNS